MKVVFVSPAATASRTGAAAANAPSNARRPSESPAAIATKMSKSATVSRKRRRLPQTIARSTPGAARAASANRRARRCASKIGRRRSLPDNPSRRTALRRFSSVFAPKPGRSRNRSPARASSKSATDATPNRSRSAKAVFGPKPVMRVNSTNSGGNSARNSSSLAIFPDSAYSLMREAVAPPMPSSSRNCGSVISAAGEANPSTMRAAAS